MVQPHEDLEKDERCCAYNTELQVSVVVHGTDFTASGARHYLGVHEAQHKAAFDLKIRGGSPRSQILTRRSGS